MRQFLSSLIIFSLLHLSIPSALAGNSQKKTNFMKTFHELPDMAAGGLLTAEGLDDIIARGKEVVAEESSDEEKQKINDNIIIPLQRVRDGRKRLDDCISKRDPNSVERVGVGYFRGAFSKMTRAQNTCVECNAENPDWSQLSMWGDEMMKITSELEKDSRDYSDDQTMDLKNRLFESERERILVPYLAMKAMYDKEPLADTPEEVMKKIGLATTVADTLPVIDLPLMPVQTTINPYGQSIIDDNLKRTIENMIVESHKLPLDDKTKREREKELERERAKTTTERRYERIEQLEHNPSFPFVNSTPKEIDLREEKTPEDREKAKQEYFEQTSRLINNYNESYKKFHDDDGNRYRDQIQKSKSAQQRIGREMASLERAILHERDETKRKRLMLQMQNLQSRLNSEVRSQEWTEKNLAELQVTLTQLEHSMAINPIVNGSALDRQGHGKKAYTVREQLFHQEDYIVRTGLTPDQMEEYLQLYYQASENLLKSLDKWNRDPDPSQLIQNTIYANPAVAGEILSENPEMAGRLCHFVEKGVKEKDRQKRWDKIMDWAKIVALVALILASGGAMLAGGVAIAAAMGLGLASASYNAVRGLQLRTEYQQAKEHLIALGVGSEAEVEGVLKLSKRRFVNMALDLGLSAGSGLAMINGLSTVNGGLNALAQSTSTIAGMQKLIEVGAKTTVLGFGSVLLISCDPIINPLPVIEDDGDIGTDTDYNPDDYDYSQPCLLGHSDYRGPLNADGCPSKYPIDRDCYQVNDPSPTFSWEYSGSLSLVNMFKLYWGSDGNNFPFSEVSISNETEMAFDFSRFGGRGEFYVSASAVGFDMVESGKAAPIMVKICQ